MAKLKLKLPKNLGDILTKEEMKKVLGGTGSGSLLGSGDFESTNTGSSCSISTVCPNKSTVSCSGIKNCERIEKNGKVGVQCDERLNECP